MSQRTYDVPFEPRLHQWHAYQATFQHDVTWLCGGLGAGKTYLLVQWVYDMASDLCKGIDGLVVEPDYSTFDDTFMRIWRSCIPGEDVIWSLRAEKGSKSKTKNLVVYWPKPGGGRGETTIFVRSAVDQRNVQRIDGLTTVGWWGLDEPARMTCGYSAFEKCIGRGRVQTPLGHNPGLIVGSPRGLAHWTCNTFGLTEDHPPHAYTRGYQAGKPGYFVRACTTADNEPNLGKGYAERMRVAYGEEFWLQEACARLVRTEGAIFPGWYKSVHVVPHQVALQLYETTIRRRGATDWGWTAPACNLALGATPDEELVIPDEWYHRRRQAHEQGANAAAFRDSYGAVIWECDPHRPDLIDLWLQGFEFKGQEYQIEAVPADNAWDVGINNLRNLMHVRGVGELDHPAHPPGNRLGRPRLFISDRCVNLALEFSGYTEIPLKEGQPPHEGAQGPDHAIDGARYGAQALIRPMEFEGVQAEI